MESKKWYGLTIPKKAAKVNTKSRSVFESDDSDVNAEDHVTVKKEPSSSSKEKKKKNPESKPEGIDPNIYEYDSIYDEMKASQKQKTSHTKSKESRYINLLMKAADKRKKEGERRIERKIQAERVKEGDAFKDKDSFVTSAYRKKMAEMEEEEERERRESVIEEMMDSTKQKDLSGFYRHFLKQTVGEEKIPEFGERDAKMSDTSKNKQDCLDADRNKQRSESPPGARSKTKHSSSEKKDSRIDKPQTEKSHKSNSFSKYETKESEQNMHRESDRSGHSKSKISSHKSRQESYSSSDSESRKSKYISEKSHRKKTDRSVHSSKHVNDEKHKNLHSLRDQEEKVHNRTKADCLTAMKQTSPSERYDNGPSSSEIIEKSKHGRDRGHHKKGGKTHHRTEKGSSQTNSRPSSDDQSGMEDKRSNSKNRADNSKSGDDSNYSHGDEVKKHSKRRESRTSEEYPESKRRKHSDADSSNSSSGEEEVEVKTRSSQEEEGKVTSENPKVDMATKFAKRTVGKIFDEAQARYFKRRDAAKAMN